MEFRQKDVAVTASGVETDYVIRVVQTPQEVDAAAWNQLLAQQAQATPFMRFEYLTALHTSGSAVPRTGWAPHFITLWRAEVLEAACVLYVKPHSYGEYVFDWAWADAYQRHGLEYYPKLLSAVPFTPVAGPRLLARDSDARAALIEVLRATQQATEVSSTHILFPPEEHARQLQEAGFLLRSGVQFHWLNNEYADFDAFLATLEQKKRKNIRAERRKVKEAGVLMRRVRGADITDDEWRFFNRCYRHTYAAHYSTPYLNLDFFRRIGAAMPENILLVIAERAGRPIAASLVIHTADTLYGRYWGEIEHVPCLHFEAAYYQPLEFCIEQGIKVFEGGAQGEHKMARGFLPTRTFSAHWLAHPSFADAIERFLEREAGGIDDYMDELNERNPFRNAAG